MLIFLIMHKRLKRLGCVWINNPRYFITICTNGKNSVLAEKGVVEVLLSEWESALERHRWAVGSYVVMPDHVHFFCTDTGQKTCLSDFIASWKEWTSKRVKRECGIVDFSWQRGFFDHLLRSNESYSEKWNYVWKNPVRAGLVENADDWPYWGHVHYR